MKLNKTLTYLIRVTLACFVFIPVLSISDDHSKLILTNPPYIMGSLAWNWNDTLLAVGTNTGACLHSTNDLSLIRCHSSSVGVYSIDWQPHGNLIASAGSTSNVNMEVWNSQTDEILSELSGFNLAVTSVVWSPDGSKIASSSLDGNVQISAPLTGKAFQNIKIDDGGDWYSLTWSPDGKMISLHSQGKFTMLDTMTGNSLRLWTSLAYSQGAKLSPNGNLTAAAEYSGNAYVWDVNMGSITSELKVDDSFKVITLAWRPDSKRMALVRVLWSEVNTGDSQLEFWDIGSAQRLAVIPHIYMTGDGRYNNGVAWSHDGKRLASISDDGKVYIWDAETYKQIAIYEAYSPTN